MNLWSSIWCLLTGPRFKLISSDKMSNIFKYKKLNLFLVLLTESNLNIDIAFWFNSCYLLNLVEQCCGVLTTATVRKLDTVDDLATTPWIQCEYISFIGNILFLVALGQVGLFSGWVIGSFTDSRIFQLRVMRLFGFILCVFINDAFMVLASFSYPSWIKWKWPL